MPVMPKDIAFFHNGLGRMPLACTCHWIGRPLTQREIWSNKYEDRRDDLSNTATHDGRTKGPDGADDSRVSAVDRLVELIRQLITERGLQVGDQLPTERELGELYVSSRNTVREALQVLRAYGIVETKPKVGAVISGGGSEAMRKLFAFHSVISPESFRDVQGFRRIIEVGVGDHIILNATEKDFARLDEKNALVFTATSVTESARRDYEFHEAIVELSGNLTTLAAYRMLRPVIEEIMHVGKTSRPAQLRAFEAHAELVAALRSRDRVAYTYLLGRHLEYGLQFVGPEPNPA